MSSMGCSSSNQEADMRCMKDYQTASRQKGRCEKEFSAVALTRTMFLKAVASSGPICWSPSALSRIPRKSQATT